MEKPAALIVDDDMINRLILEKMLASLDFITESAASGKEALSKISKKQYSVIFTDIQMPDMDGYQTTSAIRSVEGGEGIPIIAVTANALDEDRAKAKQAGMDGFLTKPVLLSDIQEVVTEINIRMMPNPQKLEPPQTDDINALITKVSGDIVFVRKMLNRMEANTSELLREMRETENVINPEKRSGLKHKLKGLLSAVNASQAIKVLEDLPDVAYEQDPAPFYQHLELLEEEIFTYLAQSRELIKSDPKSQEMGASHD
jgi:CheY-like chemotaxis protein